MFFSTLLGHEDGLKQGRNPEQKSEEFFLLPPIVKENDTIPDFAAWLKNNKARLATCSVVFGGRLLDYTEDSEYPSSAGYATFVSERLPHELPKTIITFDSGGVVVDFLNN